MANDFLSGYYTADESLRRRADSNMGQLQGLLAVRGAAQNQAREEGLRNALAKLPPDATQEQVLSAVTPYASADTLARTIQSSQDRRAAQETALTGARERSEAMLQAARERVAGQIEAARQRGEDQRVLRQMIIEGQQGLARLAASLRQPTAPTVTEIADPNDPTKAIKIDARTGQKIGDAPPKPKLERALPGPLQKQLTEASELSDAASRFRGSFNENYAGDPVTGEFRNTVGRYFGDDTGRAQWWQDYELHQSQIRNKLFGSALTAPEIEAWNKSAINPRMDSGEVRKNLIRREALERRAIDRLIRGATAGGYSREQIEAFTGRSGDAPPVQAPPAAPGANNRLRFDAQGNPIQ